MPYKQNLLLIPAFLALVICLDMVLTMSRTKTSPSVYAPNDVEKMRQCFAIFERYKVDLNAPGLMRADIEAFAKQLQHTNPEMQAEVLGCLTEQKALCSSTEYAGMKPFLCQNVNRLESELQSLLIGGENDDMWTTVSDVSAIGNDTHLSGIGTI